MKKFNRFLLLHSIDSDIPDDNKVGLQRFRLFRMTTLFALMVFLIFMVQIYVADPIHAFSVTLIVLLFVGVFVNYFALAMHRNTKLAYVTLVFILFTLLHVTSYYTGGIRNSAMFFLTSIILTTYMLAGRKTGMIMSGFSLLQIIYLFLISRYTDWTNYDLIGTGPSLIDFDYLTTGLISILVVNSQSAFLEKSKEAIVNDVYARTEEIRLKNAELENKNRDLEQFAYVASHDMQEPLRTISAFAEMLEKKCHDKMDERAAKYLGYIMQSSDRMKVLISDLLEYSHIGTTKVKESLNCNVLLENVIVDLGKAICESKTEIRFSNLPMIVGYGTEMKQLFQNLLANAIKFRKKDIPSVVSIDVSEQCNEWKFSFKDNGIGIDPKHKERIFIIFQRLHNRSEYAGSGIGLSHCKKIVELHNGKIWVESEPGEGSNFIFTIKKNHNK